MKSLLVFYKRKQDIEKRIGPRLMGKAAEIEQMIEDFNNRRTMVLFVPAPALLIGWRTSLTADDVEFEFVGNFTPTETGQASHRTTRRKP